MNKVSQENFTQNLESSSLVVIADVHLRSLDDKRGKLLLETLEQIKNTPVEYLVLLGDIFDFCAGQLKYFQKKFEFLFLQLNNLATQGIKVIFIQGNHEFYLDQLPWKQINFVTTKDTSLILGCGTKIAFCHGDLLFSSPSYQFYYYLVRSRVVKKIVSIFPGKILENFCFHFSDFSKSVQKNKKLCLETLYDKMRLWLSEKSCQHAVSGHFHTPFLVDTKITQGKLVGTHGWEKPNVLLFGNNKFVHVYL
jgi:UDP-2,3-diacylglucosamine hydrolase